MNALYQSFRLETLLETLAAVTLGGLSFAGMVCFFLFGGWFGVGLFCMLALSASVRAELFEDHGNVHEFDTPRTIEVYRRRMEARRQLSAEAREAVNASADRRRMIFKAINGFFFVCMVASFAVYYVWGL